MASFLSYLSSALKTYKPGLEQVKSEPMDSGPMESGPMESGPMESGPMESEQVKSEPMESEQVKSEPMESEPMNSEPSMILQIAATHQESTKPDPATSPAKQANRPTRKPKKHFPFIKLPPELRNRIYEMALMYPYKNIDIVFKAARHDARCAIGTRKVTDKKEQNDLLHKHFRLLATSRQVNAEASSTLYGGNQFSFFSLHALKLFLVAIGEARRHLRRLSIQGRYITGHAELAFALLAQSKQMRCIELGSMIRFDRHNALGFFRVLKPFLVAFARERRSNTAGLELIKWSGDTGDARWGKWSEEEQADFRRRLQQYFDGS